MPLARFLCLAGVKTIGATFLRFARRPPIRVPGRLVRRRHEPPDLPDPGSRTLALSVRAATWFSPRRSHGDISQNDPAESTSALQRLQTVTSSSEELRATAVVRWDRLLAAFRRIEDQQVLASGSDRASGETETGYPVHNIIVKAWYQAGLLGFTGMLPLLLTIGVGGWRAMNHARDALEKRIAPALLSGFVAFPVFGSRAPCPSSAMAGMPTALVPALGPSSSALPCR